MKVKIENFMNGMVFTYDRMWNQAKEYSRKCQQVYKNIYTL